MNEDVKAKLEAILERDRAKLQEIAETESNKKSEAEERRERWSNQVNGTLTPALQAVVDMLNQSGWVSKIETTDKSLMMQIGRGNMRGAAGTDRPYIQFELSATGDIRVSQSTPSQASGDRREYKMEELTPDFVQKRVTQFFEVLALK